MKNLLTAQQVADYLGVKLSTIRKWCHYGFIPKVKLGGAVRFDPDALDAWIEKRSSDGRPKMRVSAYESKARRSAQRLITLRTD
jgi:excisionase family DNA binding protein